MCVFCVFYYYYFVCVCVAKIINFLKDVEKDLPAKIETNIYTGLSKVQRKLYTSVLTRDVSALQG